MRNFAVVLLLCSLAFAADPRLHSAKTVYIDNQSGYQQFYEEVKRDIAPRFTEVDRKDADLIVVLTVQRTDESRLAVMTVMHGEDTVWSNTRHWARVVNAPKALAKDFLRFAN